MINVRIQHQEVQKLTPKITVVGVDILQAGDDVVGQVDGAVGAIERQRAVVVARRARRRFDGLHR